MKAFLWICTGLCSLGIFAESTARSEESEASSVVEQAPVIGEHPLKSFTSVSVHLRIIEAKEYVANKENAQGERAIAASLDDLSGKLLKLPYRNFQLTGENTLTIPLTKKETLLLSPEESITIRPITIDEKKICLWIRWEDRSGMKILDSRMHLNVGESIVAGTEHSDDQGTILAIDVAPVAN